MSNKFLILLLFLPLLNFAVADNLFGCKQDRVIEGSLPSSNASSMLAQIKSKFAATAQPWLPTEDSGTLQLFFAIEKIESARKPQDRRFVLQLGLVADDHSSNSVIFGSPVDTSPSLSNAISSTDGLFNCYIDRHSSANNPRCCYNEIQNSVQSELSNFFPPCPGFQMLKCQAICHYDLIIQIEFADNVGQGGQVSVSMLSSRVSLLQKDGQFTEIENDLGDVYVKPQISQRGSHISKGQAVGFWLKWIDFEKRNPILEIGRDGVENPFFSHKFDSDGWNGIEIQLPRMGRVFKPKAWSADAIQGNILNVYSECENIVNSRYVAQKYLGGTCLSDRQCTKKCSDPFCTVRKCLPDSQLLSSLKWTNHRTCQVPPPPNFPLEIAIIFFLLALLLFSCLILICCNSYYVGSTRHKMRKTKTYKIDAAAEDLAPIPVYVDHSAQSLSYVDHSQQSEN